MSMSQSKIQQLSSLFPLIISDIKKDIKNELIKFDYATFKKLFGKCYVAKLTVEELAPPLFQEISTNPKLEDWIVERWVEKHVEMYRFFAQHLSKVNPNFDEIQSLPDEVGEAIANAAIAKFGVKETYLFSVLNKVAFSPALFEKLKNQATAS